MTTGKKIKALRELRQLSQHDLAAELNKRYKGANFSREMIAHWEIDAHLPYWDKAMYLARYFRITLDELFFTNLTPLKATKELRKVA